MKSLLLALGIICIAAPALALPIKVDPTGPALTGTYAVEWNTDANFENWTNAQTTSAAVPAGKLTGTSTGGGPYLDLGFNDVLKTRIQVPATYLGDIQIFIRHHGPDRL